MSVDEIEIRYGAPVLPELAGRDWERESIRSDTEKPDVTAWKDLGPPGFRRPFRTADNHRSDARPSLVGKQLISFDSSRRSGESCWPLLQDDRLPPLDSYPCSGCRAFSLLRSVFPLGPAGEVPAPCDRR